MSRPHVPIEKRFWNKVHKTSSCWIWQGATKGRDDDYGCVRINGRGEYAHRVAYELVKGPIPNGLHLDHLCRERLCVNPDHLEPVDNRTNILRGIGPTAANARMKFCKRGHELNDQNVSITSAGSRQCNPCRRFNYAMRAAKNKS
jgi:hypothetical protein